MSIVLLNCDAISLFSGFQESWFILVAKFGHNQTATFRVEDGDYQWKLGIKETRQFVYYVWSQKSHNYNTDTVFLPGPTP